MFAVTLKDAQGGLNPLFVQVPCPTVYVLAVRVVEKSEEDVISLLFDFGESLLTEASNESWATVNFLFWIKVPKLCSYK